MLGRPPSPSLAPPRSLRTRRIRQGAKNFCCAKLGPCRVFASLLALGQNLSGFRTTGQAKGAGREQTEAIMSNFELQEKAVKAATRFIERKGYELLETGWTFPEGTRIDLIASDEDTLVFIDVTATEYGEGGFEGGKVKRGDLEIAAASWLAVNSPDGEMQVRFDIIDMLVVSADRVLLRHHINAFSCGIEQPTSIPAPAGGPGWRSGSSRGALPVLTGRSS